VHFSLPLLTHSFYRERTRAQRQSFTSNAIDYSLNLSILLSEGKETNWNSFSSGERTRNSPTLEICRLHCLSNCSAFTASFLWRTVRLSWLLLNSLRRRVIFPFTFLFAASRNRRRKSRVVWDCNSNIGVS